MANCGQSRSPPEYPFVNRIRVTKLLFLFFFFYQRAALTFTSSSRLKTLTFIANCAATFALINIQDLLRRFTLNVALFLWDTALNTPDQPLTQPERVVLGPKGFSLVFASGTSPQMHQVRHLPFINSLLAAECKAARGTVDLYEDERGPVRAARPCNPKSCLISDRHTVRTSFFLSQTPLIIISTSPRFAHIFPFLSPSSCRCPLTIPRSPTVAPSLDD